MKRLFVIALLMVGCGGVASTTAIGSPAASAGALPTGWVAFSSPDGSFSVGFPIEPNATSESVPNEAGSLAFHFFEAKSADQGTDYAVSYTDVPTVWQVDDRDRALDDAVVSGVAASNATLQQSHTINLGPVPGRDWTAVSGGRKAHGRVFATGSRMYQVFIDGALANEQEFLDSFAIR